MSGCIKHYRQQRTTAKNRSSHMIDKHIKLSDDLISEANAYLEKLPKTPEQVIEQWAQLGQKLADELTELQTMQFLLGDLDIKVEEKAEIP
jgi:cytochrome c553